jgi:hypothetical protein
MANVIEFYIPVRFRKAAKWGASAATRTGARISSGAKANCLTSADQQTN